jgi:hypothetical protein
VAVTCVLFTYSLTHSLTFISKHSLFISKHSLFISKHSLFISKHSLTFHFQTLTFHFQTLTFHFQTLTFHFQTLTLYRYQVHRRVRAGKRQTVVGWITPSRQSVFHLRSNCRYNTLCACSCDVHFVFLLHSAHADLTINNACNFTLHRLYAMTSVATVSPGRLDFRHFASLFYCA